jgi:hypothetical protein
LEELEQQQALEELERLQALEELEEQPKPWEL